VFSFKQILGVCGSDVVWIEYNIREKTMVRYAVVATHGIPYNDDIRTVTTNWQAYVSAERWMNGSFSLYYLAFGRSGYFDVTDALMVKLGVLRRKHGVLRPVSHELQGVSVDLISFSKFHVCLTITGVMVGVSTNPIMWIWATFWFCANVLSDCQVGVMCCVLHCEYILRAR
jgi:hypothetical protein